MTTTAATLSSAFRLRNSTSEVAAADGADGLGVDANGFAELADKYRLGGVVDEVDGGDFADLGAGLHGDNALAPGGGFEPLLNPREP
jgi:hypothetical protein